MIHTHIGQQAKSQSFLFKSLHFLVRKDKINVLTSMTLIWCFLLRESRLHLLSTKVGK